MAQQNGCSMDLAVDEDGLEGAVDGVVVDGASAINGHTSAATSVDAAASAGPSSSAPPISRVDRDVIRLIAQHLQNLGLNRTVELLAAECGCPLEHPIAVKFRSYVMDGDWDQAEAVLSELQPLLSSPSDLTKMRFHVLEQKYLELLDDGRHMDGLNCLRNQISALRYNTKRVHKLSSYLMLASPEDLRHTAKWAGKGRVSRSKLMDTIQGYLPNSVMIPPRRLMVLLSQAVEWQMDHCRFHNTHIDVSATNLDSVNIMTDHICTRDHFPCTTTQVLSQHNDEVWFCRFSPDGSKLATGSKDGTLCIWDVDFESHQVRLRRSFEGHQRGVSHIAWSPDSLHVIVCGPEDSSELIIWNTETFEARLRLNNSPMRVCSENGFVRHHGNVLDPNTFPSIWVRPVNMTLIELSLDSAGDKSDIVSVPRSTR